MRRREVARADEGYAEKAQSECKGEWRGLFFQEDDKEQDQMGRLSLNLHSLKSDN